MLTLTACGKAPTTAKVIEIELTNEEYAFGVDKQQPELLETVNKFIAEIKADGTFDEICNNYFGDGTPVAVTSATFDPNKEQLVVATNAAFEPFEFMEGENYYGIDLEIAAKLAEYLGINKKNTAAVGDYYNDVDMFKRVEHPVCCGQAPDDIKEMCEHVTCHCNNGAVAEFINYIENKYIK